MSKILVIGSSNTDLIAKVDRFPESGETIEAEEFLQAMGGKGANQAMAAHRLGGQVNLITSLGNDSYGQNTLKYYQEQGLRVTESMTAEGTSSGIAMIMVDKTGENCIIITPGANEKLSSGYINSVEHAIDEAKLIVLQMEIPYDTISTICDVAIKKNKKIILNAAPARSVDRDLVKKVDILLVNETEAETITGEKIEDIGKVAIVSRLLDMGAKAVILTLGDDGCFFQNREIKLSMPAFKVQAKDTTGAGDTFCGALAVGLANESNWWDALEFATGASALCVTRMGAQPSIPTENEVYEFLKKYRLLTKNNKVTSKNGTSVNMENNTDTIK